MVKVVLEHRAKNLECARRLVEVIKGIRAVASQQPGFIVGETMVDVDDPCHVIVNTTWKTEEDWKAWDWSKTRNEMREELLQQLAEPYTAVTLKIGIVWEEDLLHTF
jgi:heme-degrading monooxygenase HmoA